MAAALAPVSFRGGHPRTELYFPGNHSASSSIFLKNFAMASPVGWPPPFFALPSFLTLPATYAQRPCSLFPSSRQISRKAQAFAWDQADKWPSCPSVQAIRSRSATDSLMAATKAARKHGGKASASRVLVGRLSRNGGQTCAIRLA